MTIFKGVPQGSIIEPCLSKLFLNDCLYILENSSPVNYAYDKTLLETGETLMEVVDDVKKDTEAAIDWFHEYQKQANHVKFQFMHTNKNENVDFEYKNVKNESE